MTLDPSPLGCDRVTSSNSHLLNATKTKESEGSAGPHGRKSKSKSINGSSSHPVLPSPCTKERCCYVDEGQIPCLPLSLKERRIAGQISLIPNLACRRKVGHAIALPAYDWGSGLARERYAFSELSLLEQSGQGVAFGSAVCRESPQALWCEGYNARQECGEHYWTGD
jgi:hypothetical protein